MALSGYHSIGQCKCYCSQVTINRTNLLPFSLQFSSFETYLIGFFRMVCEQILSCERLVYQNKNFWIESFQLIRKIINGVDYKGVREIMKGCRDKIQSFPYNINLSIMPQMKAVESLIEYIFDRNACLLPAYFIGNEIQKSGPLHWKISQLTCSFVEDFRNCAQMVSIIGHIHMLPIVEHFGYTDSLIQPWKLDLNTLKFTTRGILPYDPELYQPQKNLLRYVLEQPYSKDMVSSMLNLPKPVWIFSIFGHKWKNLVIQLIIFKTE